jgi:hypothetical protein
MAKQITVTQRSDDYKAEADKGQWGSGATPGAAVSDLEKSWPETKELPVVESK